MIRVNENPHEQENIINSELNGGNINNVLWGVLRIQKKILHTMEYTVRRTLLIVSIYPGLRDVRSFMYGMIVLPPYEFANRYSSILSFVDLI